MCLNGYMAMQGVQYLIDAMPYHIATIIQAKQQATLDNCLTFWHFNK